MTPRAHIIRPALFAPAVLSAIAVVGAVQWSWWSLAALPFIWLGSLCAQPNLNGANGCLAYLAIFVGIALIPLFKALGIAMLTGSMCGFYLSTVEKWPRMRPAPDA